MKKTTSKNHFCKIILEIEIIYRTPKNLIKSLWLHTIKMRLCKNANQFKNKTFITTYIVLYYY